MTSERGSWRLVLSSGAARGYMLLTELALLLMTAHWLPVAERGNYAAAMSLIKGLAIVAFLSLGQVAIHRLSSATSRERCLALTAGSLSLANILLFTAAFALFAGASGLFPSLADKFFRPFGLLTAVGLPLFIAEQYLTSLLLTLGRLQAANLWTIIGRTAAVVVAVAVIRLSSWGASGIVASVILGQALLVAGAGHQAWRELTRQGIRPTLSWSDFLAMVRSGLKLHPSALGSLVFGNVDVLLLFDRGGPAQVAIYQLALQMVSGMTVLPYAVGQVGYTQVAQFGPDAAWKRYRRLLLTSSVLMLSVAAALGLSVNQWLPYILGPSYQGAAPLFQIMLLGFPGTILSMGMAPQWVGRGHFAATSLLTIVTGVAGIAANVWAIDHHGSTGAAWVFCAVQLLGLVTNGFYIRLVLKDRRS